MRARHSAMILGLLVTAVACQDPGGATFDTEEQKASYAIGLNMGGQLGPAGELIDMAALRAGLEDALAEREPRFPGEELQAALQTFNEALQAEAAAEGERNAEEGEAFLATNGTKDGITTTGSGLQYEVLREGDGPNPGPTDRVMIHYRGTLIDGTEFDSSYERGEPSTFGVNGVIPGFSEGLQLMPVGSHFRFFIPGSLGYGLRGSPPSIGPNATLIFEVEMLEIPGS